MNADLFSGQRVISHVYVLPSGSVFTFDERNNPMWEYCGKWDELETTIRQAMPRTARIH